MPKKKIKTVKEILTEALALIDNFGWIRGQLSSPEGYCAAGAINQAAWGKSVYFAGVSNELYQETEKARNALKEIIGEESIVVWNDSYLIELQDVRQAFLDAIAAEI